MRRILIPIIAFLAIAVFWLNGEKRPGNGELSRKADYIYMEGQRHYQLDELGDYFNMMLIAHTLDSVEPEYKKELGYYLMLLADKENGLDSSVFINGYDMLRRAVENDSTDFYTSLKFAALCQHFGFDDESLKIWRRLMQLYPNKPEVAFNYADLLFQQGDTAHLHEALAIYSFLEKTQGKSLGLYSQKIRAYLTMHDTANVIQQIDSVLALSPNNISNQLYIGDVYMVMGYADSALWHYNRALEIDSTSGMAYHKLAEYYKYVGDSAKYDTEVFHALSQPDLDVPDKVELMRGYVQSLFMDSLQRPRIEKLFDILTTQHPHEAEIRDLYSVYLAVVGDYKNSAEQTSICVDLNPAEITNWNRLISLYFTLDDATKALETAKNGMYYFPNDAGLKLMAASALLQENRPDSAVVYLRTAYDETDKHDVETLSQIETTMGDAFHQMHISDSAFVHYDRALELNPHNQLAMNNAAYFMACDGIELDRAENLSYLTIRDNPDNGTYLDTYAWVLFKQKKYEEAKRYIDKTMEVEENPSAELYEHAGDIYFMNLLPEEAIEYWKQALELEPDNTLLQKKVKEKRYIVE